MRWRDSRNRKGRKPWRPTRTQDERAQIFLNFARFPASRVEGDCLSELLVQFADHTLH